MLNTELFDNFGSFHLQLSLHTMIVLECGSTWCNFVFKATLIPPIKQANTPIVLIYGYWPILYSYMIIYIYVYIVVLYWVDVSLLTYSCILYQVGLIIADIIIHVFPPTGM